MARAAVSVERYAGFFKSAGVVTVLDYGAGYLRNALYLADLGFTVYAADLPRQIKTLRRHSAVGRLAGLLSPGDLKRGKLAVDLVVCTYVFNIIIRRAHKESYLDNVVANLRPGGFLLIEVTSRQKEAGCATALHHYHCCNDRARSFTHTEIDSYLEAHRFRRVCHYYSSHALAAVYRLTPAENSEIKTVKRENPLGADA